MNNDNIAWGKGCQDRGGRFGREFLCLILGWTFTFASGPVNVHCLYEMSPGK